MPLADAIRTPLQPTEFAESDALPVNIQTLRNAQIAGAGQFERGWTSADLSGRVGDLYIKANEAERAGNVRDAAVYKSYANDLEQQAALWAPRVQNVTDVHSLGDAADWAAGAMGNLRTSVEPAIGGLVGAGVGALAAPFTGGLVNPVNAGFLGASIMGVNAERGEAMSNAYNDKQVVANKTPEEINTASWLKGVANGILEAMVPTVMGGKVLTGAGIKALTRQALGKAATKAEREAAEMVEREVQRQIANGGLEAAVKAVAKEQGKETLGEFVTEGTQSLVGQAAQNYLQDKPLGNLDYRQAFNEGAAGAVGGAGMGTVGGLGEVGHAYAARTGDKVAEIKRDPVGAAANVVADTGSVVGKAAARGLDAFERMLSPAQRAHDTLVGNGGTPAQHQAAATQWAQHVLENPGSSEAERSDAARYVQRTAEGDDAAWSAYRDALTIRHHEAQQAASDTAVADEIARRTGGKKSLMQGTLVDDFGESEGRDPSDDSVVDDYGTRVRSGMDGADAAAHATLSQVGQPVIPPQGLTVGQARPSLESAADIWRKQGVADGLLQATSDKTDPAQRAASIAMLGWIKRGFTDTDGNVFVPESITKRYGQRSADVILSAAKTAFKNGLVDHDVLQQLPQITELATKQYADATTVRDAVRGAIPEYIRDDYSDAEIDRLTDALRDVARTGTTPKQEAVLLRIFGSKEALAQAMSKFETPRSGYGKQLETHEATTLDEEGAPRANAGEDHEGGLTEAAPNTAVNYAGWGKTGKPFNTLYENAKSALKEKLSQLHNDPSVYARSMGAHDALLEQYGKDHPYRREAENELLWSAVKTAGHTAEDRTRYIADIEALEPKQREAALHALNRTHRVLRIEQVKGDGLSAENVRPEQVESFRETRAPGSPYVTPEHGTIYLERKARVDSETGEQTGKNEAFITTTHKLLRHVWGAENTEGSGTTLNEARGLAENHDAVLRGLAALIESDGTFTGRVGFKDAAAQREPAWQAANAPLPGNLRIGKGAQQTVSAAMRAAAVARRNDGDGQRGENTVRYAETLAEKAKELKRLANVHAKESLGRQIVKAIAAGEKRINELYTELRNRWDGTTEAVGDLVEEKPSSRDDIVPSEHRGDEPIYRNADWARIGLGTDAEGAGYEGHAPLSERAAEPLGAPLATKETPERIAPRNDPLVDARDWAADTLRTKGVPALMAARAKMSAAQAKITIAGLNELASMTPAQYIAAIEPHIDEADAQRVLKRAALARDALTRNMKPSEIAEASDVTGAIANGRGVGADAATAVGQRDALAGRGGTQSDGGSDSHRLAAAAELGQDGVAGQSTDRSAGGRRQGTGEGQSREGLERSRLAGESQIAAQLKQYVDQFGSKNAVFKGAALRALAANHEAAISKKLEEAKKQFGELKSSEQGATGQRATPEQVEAVRKEVLDTLGDTVKLDFVDHFGDNSSGQWTPQQTQNVITLALNGDVLGTTYHESLHEFFDMLRKSGNEATIKLLERVASNEVLNRNLERLLKDHPAAAAQVRSSPEEAAAFLYQFWRAGQIQLGQEVGGFFTRVKNFFNKILGRVSATTLDEQRAETILRAFAGGAFKSVKGDTTIRDAALAAVREGGARHEQALENLDKAGREFTRTVGRALFSAEAMLKGTKNKYMAAIAEGFNTEAGQARGEQQSYFDGVKQQTNIWMNRLENILTAYSPEDVELARQAMATGAGGTDRVAREIVAKLHAFNEDFFKYVAERKVQRWDDTVGDWVNVGHRKDYFPRVWDTDQIMKRAAEFKERLMKVHARELEATAAIANREIAAWNGDAQAYRDAGPAAKASIGKAMDAFEKTSKAVGKVSPQRVTTEQVADAIVQRLLNAHGHVELSESTSRVGVSPFAASVNRRSLSWIDDKEFDDFKSKDVARIMTTYVASMVKRAESTRVFGNGGERTSANGDRAILLEMGGDKLVREAEGLLPNWQRAWKKAKAQALADGQLFDEPFPTLRAVGLAIRGTQVGIEQRNAELNTAVKALDQGFKAVMAMEGTLGADISQSMRSVNSLLATYQTLRVLPLVLFSSLNDVMGIVAQGGELRDAWEALVRGMREIRLRWKDEKTTDLAARRAEEWGTVDAGTFMDTLGQTYGSMYMSAKMRRVSDTFFKWNGMEAWNRATRITASAVAERAIKALKTEGVDANDKAAVARVEHLFGKGFDVKNIKLDADGELDINDPMNQAAMMRWVSNAIMSPNAAHRTIWGSDTRLAAFWMLKQFAYTFHRVMLNGALEQAKLGNLRPIMTLALGYAPMTIAAGAVKEMLVPGDEPPWMKGGLDSYLSYGISRAGIFGVPGMAYDALTSHNGVLAGALGTAGGPTVNQLVDIPFNSAGKTLLGAAPFGSLLRRAAD